MSNLNPQQFGQLPMFMTPHEIGQVPAGDWDLRPMSEAAGVLREQSQHHAERSAMRWGSDPSTATSHLDHLKADVEQDGGIQEPAEITHPAEGQRQFPPHLTDGHHRATVALETNRLLPVTHVLDNR